MTKFNQALICIRCLNFVGWSDMQYEAIMCDKCRKKDMEHEILKNITKELIS